MAGVTLLAPCWQVIPMAVDARYRDKDGEISRKHGNTLVGRLRISYGRAFAQGCADDDKLSNVLAKLKIPHRNLML
jgi:hypothetical protein